MPEQGGSSGDAGELAGLSELGIKGREAGERAKIEIEQRIDALVKEKASAAVDENKDSVEIAMNNNGEVSFRVKVYANNINNAIIKAQSASLEMMNYRHRLLVENTAIVET